MKAAANVNRILDIAFSFRLMYIKTAQHQHYEAARQRLFACCAVLSPNDRVPWRSSDQALFEYSVRGRGHSVGRSSQIRKRRGSLRRTIGEALAVGDMCMSFTKADVSND